MDVKVTHIPGTYSKGGKQYGPFTATPEKPYIEVPLGIQMTQNLPLYDEGAAEAEAAEGQSLLDANASLKADLERVQRELDAETRKGDQAYESYVQSYDQFEADRKSFKEQLSAARAELETAQREVTDLKSIGQKIAEERDTLGQQLAEAQARALPADALERIKKVSGVADKHAQPILDALTAPAAEEPAQ